MSLLRAADHRYISSKPARDMEVNREAVFGDQWIKLAPRTRTSVMIPQSPARGDHPRDNECYFESLEEPDSTERKNDG